MEVEYVEPQHVWVDVTGRWGVSAETGILFARRKIGRGDGHVWQGWVIQVSRGPRAHGGEVSMYQRWVDAALIKLAPTEHPAFDASGFHPVNSDGGTKGRPA